MDNIELRPHHISEVYRRLTHTDYYFQSRDDEARNYYGNEFIDFMDSLMLRILSEPELRITIVEGIDTLCKQCKKISECEGKDTYMDTHDILTKWPIFHLNDTYRAEDLVKKINQYINRND